MAMTYRQIPGPLGRETVWKLNHTRLEPSPEQIQAEQNRKLSRYVPQETPRLVADPQLAMPDPREMIVPVEDGQVTLFEFTDLAAKKQGSLKNYLDSLQRVQTDMDRTRRALFINGMGNSGDENKQASCVLSLLLMCPVISVYNKSEGFVPDLVECLREKIPFQAWTRSPQESFDLLAKDARSPEERVDVMCKVLESGKYGNRAMASLFRELSLGDASDRDIPLYAHTQGNLILSNSLQAVKIALGPSAIQGRMVMSYGSPAIMWPGEIKQFDFAIEFNLASLLNIVPRWRVARLGWPSNAVNPHSHGFRWYLQEDAALIINRHRVGGMGITMNIDERALATELATFGHNEPRLLRVFHRLDSMHNSDVDDVANFYIDAMRKAKRDETLRLMPTLVRDLIRYLDEGWTTSGEKDRIAYLKGLLNQEA